MKRFILLGLAVAIMGGTMLVSDSTSAAPNATGMPTGITVTPFLQAISVAGFESTKNFKVQVTNHTSTTRNFKVSVADFGAANEFGGIAFLGLKNSDYAVQHGLASSLKIDRQNFTLSANQTITLTGTINNDVNLLPGGHYGAILLNESGSGHVPTNSIAANPSVSSLIFVTKLGGEHYDLHLAGIGSDTNVIHLPRTAQLRFENPGNVQVVPRGTVSLLAPDGSLLAKGIINQDSGYILPGSYRQFSIPLQRIKRNGWLPAHYKLQVSYRYDGYTQNATRTQEFFYWNAAYIALPILVVAATAKLLHSKRRSGLWKSRPKQRRKT